MVSEIRLSIIIPLFNAEKYITRCIESTLNQGIDLKQLEIIVVDDESTDQSVAVVKKLVNSNGNIYLYKQKNKGPGAARNFGTTKAKGNYIYFIDADDYLIDSELFKILELAEENDLEIMGFDSMASTALIEKNEALDTNELTNLTIRNGCTFISEHNYKNEVWWYIIRKDFLDGLRLYFPEGRMLEDVGFTIKLLLKAEKIGYVPYKIHRYFRHQNSILSKKTKKHYQKLILDFELTVYDYEEALQLAKNNCVKQTINRIKTRQQSFVFFLISRLYKTDIPFSRFNESLKNLQKLGAYPLDSFIGTDYNSTTLRISTKIFNNKLLLKTSLWIFRSIYPLLKH